MIYKREFHEIEGVKVYIEDIQNLLLDYSYEKISFENHFLFKYKK